MARSLKPFEIKAIDKTGTTMGSKICSMTEKKTDTAVKITDKKNQ